MAFPLNKPSQGDTDWATEVNENWTDLDTLESDAVKDSDIGVTVQGFDADLSALAGLTGTGLVARTGAATYAERSVAGGTGIDVSDGSGASGNPTVALDIPGLAGLTAPATGDSLAIVDASDSNTQKEITLADALTVINALTADASPDGAADYVVTYDGSASAAKKVLLDDLPGGGGGGGLTDVAIQVFTSSGTYTPTSGMTQALIVCVGGGGGGGGADGTDSGMRACGGGGGAGGASIELASAATIGASKTVTIGSAGSAGSSSGGSGTSGGTSSVSGVVSAGGGSGGSGISTNVYRIGNGGLGGTGSSGNVNIGGGDGEAGMYADRGDINLVGGKGGSSILGGGGRPGLIGTSVAGSSAGTAGNNYGAGGGGAVCGNSTSGAAGGAGTKGVCVVLEFIE